jgi:hypothetical protein
MLSDEIEKELAPLTEALEPPHVETYEDQLQRLRESINDLSWIHIIGKRAALFQSVYSIVCAGYQGLLQRLCSFLGNSKGGEEENVRYVLYSQYISLRLSHIHNFLAQCLPAYAKTCTGIYPPAALQLQAPAAEFSCEVDVIYKSYFANQSVPADVNPEATASGVDHSLDDVFRPNDKLVLEPRDNSLNFLWYNSVTDAAPVADGKQVMLVFNAFLKPVARPCGLAWMSLSKVNELREL